MDKRLRILFGFIFVISLMFLNIREIKAFSSSLGTIRQEGSTVTASSGYGMALKVGTYNGAEIAVICTAYYDVSPAAKGVECTLNEERTGAVRAGVAAIIDSMSTVPISQISSESDYFIGELAINKFLYDYNGENSKNSISSSLFTSGKYKTYYDVAVSAYNNYSTANLSLSSNIS